MDEGRKEVDITEGAFKAKKVWWVNKVLNNNKNLWICKSIVISFPIRPVFLNNPSHDC